MKIIMPPQCIQVLWDPLQRRYRVLYGGRGSGKSWSVARYLLIRASSEPLRILCTREVQNSIKRSVYQLLVDQIRALGLQRFFVIAADSIKGVNGSEFIFAGLAHDIDGIRSTEGIDIVWVEEAERVSERSWEGLTPTIRNPGSHIIVVFNPDDAKSATYTRFVEKEGKEVQNPHICRALVNFRDNTMFPDVLRIDMEWDKKNDFEKYEHIWEGKPKKYAAALIFKDKYVVEEFDTPVGVTFRHGCDFGFADDAAAAVRCFIKDNKIYVDYEAFGHGVETDELPALYGQIPTAKKWKMVADSARPDTISQLKRIGLPLMVPAIKGKDSVEEGISFIRKFETVVIHPRCKHTADEFGSYRYKTDKITGEILPIPVDKKNHTIDSLRYALEDLMKAKVSIFDIYKAQQAEKEAAEKAKQAGQA